MACAMAGEYKTTAMEEERALIIIEALGAAPRARGWRRPLVAAALALGAVTVLAVKKAATPCPTAPLALIGGDALVSFALVHGPETAEMASLMTNQDSGLVKDWVLGASGRAQAAGAEEGEAGLEQAKRTVEAAMDTKDPEKAKEIVQQAFERSLSRLHEKRMDLKSYLKSHRRGLKGLPKTKSQQATTAECVFNVEQATMQIAALASNIADSAKTCTMGTNFLQTSGKVCVVNLAGIMYSISTIAASLSLAADNCASTLLPNYDALCAGGITGVIASLSQFAGAASLTSAACAPQDAAPMGVTPANFGDPTGPGGNVKRRLHDVQNATAQARRLVFGGGMRSEVTQCVVDTTSVGWWLAQAGLAINAAANRKDGESCKMPLIHKGKIYQYSQMVCAVDILGAINGFGQAVYYLQLAATQCSDQLNLPAMCGAGIDGMVSALAGGGAGGTAAMLNCWEAQGWTMTLKQNKALAAVKKVVMMSKANGLKQEGNFGRRLEAEDDGTEDLRKIFATPEAAWKSIGIDLEDPEADFHGVRPAVVRPEDLVSLVGEPAAKKEQMEDGGLLSGLQMCS
mmetsp:Transcript_115540/g.367369  ORF Transcript_115540/g.367369 Transcript_115540/m.367369 type:complete len:572 (+) Transcript_115540:61-1776(+)